jgi:phage/plasmid-associated DNA primase
MDAGLSELLKNVGIHRSVGTTNLKNIDDPFTKYTYYQPKALWKIGTDKLAELYTEYCGVVAENPQGNYCLAEIPGKEAPVILHGTLRFARNRYDGFDAFIRGVIHSVQSCFVDLLQISNDEIEYTCVVTHTNELVKIDNEYVWEFRLYFPYCVVDVDYQLGRLRSAIIDRLRSNNVFASLPQQPNNDWDFDRTRGAEGAIFSELPGRPVTMYLSREKQNSPPLMYQRIYRLIPEDAVHDEGDYDITFALNESILLPSNHAHIQRSLMDRDMMDEFQNVSDDNDDNPDCIFWLPLLLSVHFWDKVSLPKVESSQIERQLLGLLSETTDPQHQHARAFLDMINPEKAGKIYYWRDIGKALYTTFNGNDTGLELWKTFSGEERHTQCQRMYQTFNVKNYLTIKTLAWYARKDSPKEYDEWHYSWCQPALHAAGSGLESDVAEAFGRIYWLEFTCASVTKSTIFQYRNHGWSPSEGGVGITSLLSRDFLKRFESYRTQLSSLAESIEDDNIKSSNEILIKKIQILIGKLKKHTFKMNVLKELKEWFYDEEFKKVIDENPALVKTQNGVIECCDNFAVFRPGKPEDYITKNTFSYYPQDFHWGHPVVVKVRKWIRQIFCDKELEEHFLKDSASFLYGKNSEKFFRVWSGANGDNSKSMLVKLFEAALGMYVIKLPTYVFSGQTTSGPSPELARSKGAHGAIAQEPDDEEDFRGGKIKALTGGDSFFARFNHDDGGEVTAMFKIILMCNKIPMVASGGQAMHNRMIVYPFLSIWKDIAPESEEEQFEQRIFKKDPFFEDCIPELAEGFLWIMVQKFKDYKREGLMQTPKKIKEYTELYWADNDIYAVFIRETLENVYKDAEKEHIDENAGITHPELYREFKSWYGLCFPKQPIPNSPSAKNEFTRRLGVQRKHKWQGVKIAQKVVSIQ